MAGHRRSRACEHPPSSHAHENGAQAQAEGTARMSGASEDPPKPRSSEGRARRFFPNSTGAYSLTLVGVSLLAHMQSQQAPAQALFNATFATFSVRHPYPFLRERCAADVGAYFASPDVTPRHARRACEGPWRFVASSVQLHGLCKWMPKALATELGARTVASRSCAVPTWHAVPASGWCCRRQPAREPPSSSATPRCFKFTVVKAFAR